MDVTRKNFKETLPFVAKSIEKADFLVIDAEFTGLINGRDVSMFDTPQEYYTTHFHGSKEFLLIQYGLCAFYWDEVKKHYMYDAYNFYLFPRGKPEKIFFCQSSSLEFLAVQGFDFNKVIKEGISYMTEPTETRLRENLTERQKLYSNEKDFISVPEENKQYITDICKRVRQFLDEKKSDDLEIDRCNGFIRRLLFQEIGKHFKNEVFVETKILENNDRVLKVSRVKSPTDSKDRDVLKKEKEWMEFEEAIGFSKVARMISHSGKLVIGHNMLLDVMHTLDHFFQPLPADYMSFKEFAHCMFPMILDTKYMSSLPPFKDKVNSSMLQHLLATLSEAPFSMPKTASEEGRGYSRADNKQHEAGYDAYVTGLCFLAMHAHLSRMRGEPLGRVVPATSAILKPFVNKLFLAKTAHQDSPYMNLTGDDPTPSRDHVFHLTFPRDYQRNEISQLFSPFGPITVQFLDDVSALVALTRREMARGAARALAGHSRVALMPYARYKQLPRLPQKEQQNMRRENLSAMSNAHLSESITRPRTAVAVTASSATCQAGSAPHKSQKQQLPQKVERVRSNSVSAAAPPTTNRKRTSSGMFQIDDAEPPPSKKLEVRSNSDGSEPEALPNGRRYGALESKKEKTKEKVVKDKREIETFDSNAKSECVSAFKESDSWD